MLVAQLAQQRSGAPSTVGEAREGISIERILASGLYWPISEALAAYKQVQIAAAIHDCLWADLGFSLTQVADTLLDPL